jgi:hypothetical protein
MLEREKPSFSSLVSFLVSFTCPVIRYEMVRRTTTSFEKRKQVIPANARMQLSPRVFSLSCPIREVFFLAVLQSIAYVQQDKGVEVQASKPGHDMQ